MRTTEALLLGLVEGLTEFLPVSSTGHLLLVGHFLGIESTGRTFEILIQLGAILAILIVYFAKLWHLLVTLPSSKKTQQFVLSVLVAFLPAMFTGLTFHKHVKSLMEFPVVICTALVVGGFILLAVDRMKLKPFHHDVMEYTPWLAFKIGCCQVLSMIPGVSRSGATIVGAMLMGSDKRTAAEFSFFLAMPTMIGAFSYDLFKNYKLLNAADVTNIAIGFSMAFVVGLIVVRYALDFISNYGFAPFAWWRIIVGGGGLGALAVMGG
jgi:undecaprenyl-diphosphatase